MLVPLMKDFTKGSIAKSLFGLAGPIVLTNLLHSAYQLIDTFWVGRLGTDAVAAVSLSFPVLFLLITLGTGFSISGTILVAQYWGGKNREQVNYVSSQTVSLMLIVSVIVATIGYIIAGPVMKLIGAEGDVLPLATDYLQISSIGVVFMFSFFVYQSLMRGVGEIKRPLQIVALTVLLNLFLDPFFINGFGPFEGMGVTGAALATIFTQGIASAIGFWLMFRGSQGIKIQLSSFKLDPQLVKRMFFLGLPASIEQSMKALGLTMISFLVAGFGTSVVAMYGIGIRMMALVIIPAFGLSMATSTLVGQNIGAKKVDRAEKIARKSIAYGFSVLLVLGVLSFFGANLFAQTFIPDDPEVIIGAARLIRFLSFTFPFLGISLVLSGVFQGAGDTRLPMILSIIALWVFEFPLAYILSHHTELNEVGIWLASPIAAGIIAIVTYTLFRRGRWKEMRLIQDEDVALERQVKRAAQIEEGI